jgi:hypothetical protein
MTAYDNSRARLTCAWYRVTSYCQLILRRLNNKRNGSTTWKKCMKDLLKGFNYQL